MQERKFHYYVKDFFDFYHVTSDLFVPIAFKVKAINGIKGTKYLFRLSNNNIRNRDS